MTHISFWANGWQKRKIPNKNCIKNSKTERRSIFSCLSRGVRTAVGTVFSSTELRVASQLENSPDPARSPGWIQEIKPLKPTWLLPHPHKSSVIVPDYTRRCYGHNGWLSAVWQTWPGLQMVNLTEGAEYSEATCWNSCVFSTCCPCSLQQTTLCPLTGGHQTPCASIP